MGKTIKKGSPGRRNRGSRGNSLGSGNVSAREEGTVQCGWSKDSKSDKTDCSRCRVPGWVLAPGEGAEGMPSEVDWAGKYRHQPGCGKEGGGLLALQAARIFWSKAFLCLALGLAPSGFPDTETSCVVIISYLAA